MNRAADYRFQQHGTLVFGLMLLLCLSKQGAFVQNRATDEMYSSPV